MSTDKLTTVFMTRDDGFGRSKNFNQKAAQWPGLRFVKTDQNLTDQLEIKNVTHVY